MPGGDGTGPYGDLNWPCRRIYGRCAAFRGGFGLGRGWRGRTYSDSNTPAPVQPQMTKEQEITALENEAKLIEQEQQGLKSELEEIKKRIEELKKKK